MSISIGSNTMAKVKQTNRQTDRAKIMCPQILSGGHKNGMDRQTNRQQTDKQTDGCTDGQITLCPKFYLGT